MRKKTRRMAPGMPENMLNELKKHLLLCEYMQKQVFF